MVNIFFYADVDASLKRMSKADSGILLGHHESHEKVSICAYVPTSDAENKNISLDNRIASLASYVNKSLLGGMYIVGIYIHDVSNLDLLALMKNVEKNTELKQCFSIMVKTSDNNSISCFSVDNNTLTERKYDIRHEWDSIHISTNVYIDEFVPVSLKQKMNGKTISKAIETHFKKKLIPRISNGFVFDRKKKTNMDVKVSIGDILQNESHQHKPIHVDFMWTIDDGTVGAIRVSGNVHAHVIIPRNETGSSAVSYLKEDLKNSLLSRIAYFAAHIQESIEPDHYIHLPLRIFFPYKSDHVFMSQYLLPSQDLFGAIDLINQKLATCLNSDFLNTWGAIEETFPILDNPNIKDPVPLLAVKKNSSYSFRGSNILKYSVLIGLISIGIMIYVGKS